MKMKKNKTATILLLAMMIALITTTTVSSAPDNKPIAIACCRADQTTGVCDPDNPVFLNLGANCLKPNDCHSFKDWIDNLQLFPTDGSKKLLLVSMGNATIIDTDCLTDPQNPMFSKVIGRIKTTSATPSSVQTKEIVGDDKVSGITYDTPTNISTSELNITREPKNVTIWNGTANVTTEKNVTYINDFFIVEEDTIAINATLVPSAEAPATVTFNTGMINQTPPVIQKDGELCDGACENITFNMSTGELSFHTNNFSTFTTSANSNIFMIYQPTPSCSSNDSNVWFYGCSGRYGQGIDFAGQDSANSPYYWALCTWWLNNIYRSGKTVLFAGNNQWYEDFQAWLDVGICAPNMFEGVTVLGKIKGQSHHEALMAGGTTKGLIIDSEYGTIEYDTTSEINMSQVLDMTIDNLIEHDPFRIADKLIMADSEHYPTLNKKAKITFKNVESGTVTILKDGKPCPNNICTDTTYNTYEQTLSTTVTGFSTYTLQSAYTQEDVTPVLFDITGKVIVGFGSITGLLSILLGFVIIILIYKGLIKK